MAVARARVEARCPAGSGAREIRGRTTRRQLSPSHDGEFCRPGRHDRARKRRYLARDPDRRDAQEPGLLSVRPPQLHADRHQGDRALERFPVTLTWKSIRSWPGSALASMQGISHSSLTPRRMGTLKLFSCVFSEVALFAIERDLRQPVESKSLGGRRRHIDDATAHERPAIVDPDDDRISIFLVRDFHLGAEWQGSMSGGESTGIQLFTARGPASAFRGVDRGNAASVFGESARKLNWRELKHYHRNCEQHHSTCHHVLLFVAARRRLAGRLLRPNV